MSYHTKHPSIFREETIFKFVNEAQDKFNKGQQEHGGNITDRACLREAKNEVIDQMFYLSAVEEKIKSVAIRLQEYVDAYEAGDFPNINQVKTLIQELENI